MKINNRFEIAQEVFIKTDTGQQKKIVIAIVVLPGDQLKYMLSGCDSWDKGYYDFELSDEADVMTKINNYHKD